ncbi:single-stranded DNA-binding protein [Acidithiobacillus caldus ATCC 51756]|uniref:single-stranded DNA-binding protein n=1 Tax=Acidithiobacillus caldus TaxID=33059 RepID=UPI001C07C5EB|nr:single-stranded DNA-binding protein [Acidithiobacillus caldus]MBU2735924.1 single-stranded DNA-binding protein [Acidithiobacillus caldus ATCC 51756]MBU2803154.1 single-stranded DNA-binding protein [Acidithiobacillus caldus]
MSAIVILTGKVGRDIELKTLESDGRTISTTAFPVVTFESVFNKATKSYQTKAVYHRCVAYGKVAENLARLFQKGKGIQVTGSLQYREFESNGVKRKITEIHVDRFFFTDAPDAGEAAAQAAPTPPAPQPAAAAPTQTPPAAAAVPLGYSLSVSLTPPKPAAPKPAAKVTTTPAATQAAPAAVAAAGGGAPLPAMPLDDAELAELDAPF